MVRRAGKQVRRSVFPRLVVQRKSHAGSRLLSAREWREAAQFFRLSPIELGVVKGIFDELTAAQMGRKLGLAERTVRAYARRVRLKLRAERKHIVVLRVFRWFTSRDRRTEPPLTA